MYSSSRGGERVASATAAAQPARVGARRSAATRPATNTIAQRTGEMAYGEMFLTSPTQPGPSARK